MAREKGPAEIPMIMYELRHERPRPAPSAPEHCSPEGKRGEREAFGRVWEAFGRAPSWCCRSEHGQRVSGAERRQLTRDSALPGQEGFRRRPRRHLTRVGKSVGSPNRDVT